MSATDIVTIDGSAGEGGGQVLRTALTLSVCTGRPVRIVNIRAGRARPGLRPQHLAAVKAAATIANARVSGAALDSTAVTLHPQQVEPGDYHFDIGTAGSTMLLLQTVLPALLTAGGASTLLLEGGTHVTQAPTYEFIAGAYLPLIERLGPRVRLELIRPGFYPAGGGRVRVRIQPVATLAPWELHTRGALKRLAAEVVLCRLPEHIAAREIKTLTSDTSVTFDSAVVRHVADSLSPGNVVTVVCESAQVTEVVAAVGKRGVRAERVAGEVLRAVQRYLNAEVPIGRHLADQILVPLALAGAGCFVTLEPSRHTLTNITVIEQMLDVRIDIAQIEKTKKWRVEVR